MDNEARMSKGRDLVSEVIGDTGRFQWTRITILFLASTLALCHLFTTVACMAKVNFYCISGDNNVTANHCGDCDSFDYDRSFWVGGTIITEYDLVCDRAHLGGKE